MIIIPNYDFRIKQLEDRVSFLEEKTDNVYFAAAVLEDVFINEDEQNPSFFPNMQLVSVNKVSLEDSATGTFKNESGRVVEYMEGSLSFQPNKSGGGVSILKLISERSFDGVNWVGNLNSLRSIEVPNNGESFNTVISVLLDWQPDELIRFRCYNSTNPNMVFEVPTDNILNQNFEGPSMYWTLHEMK